MFQILKIILLSLIISLNFKNLNSLENNNDNIRINQDSYQVIEDKLNNKFIASNSFFNFLSKKFAKIIANRIDKLILENGFNEHLQRSFNLKSNIDYKIIENGSGFRYIKCGQIGQFNIILQNSENEIKNDDYKEDSLNINLGTSKLSSSFDIGALNMKEGERRIINIKKIEPNLKNLKQKMKHELLSEKNEIKTTLNIKLLNIIDSKKNKEIDDFYDQRINIIKSYNILRNMSPEIHCGSFVWIKFKILNESGSVIYDSDNLKNNLQYNENILSFHVGSGKMPVVFEWAVDGMHYGDQKILFIKNSDIKDISNIVDDKILENIIKNKENIILELNPYFKNI
jgi:FKBP-type peptidyl-prolyl cis-trans isomerase 2